MADVPGFEIPIHQSLTAPLMMGGVPRKYALIVWTLTAAICLGMHQLIFLPIGILAHLIGVRLAKTDPYFTDCLTRHLKQKEYLEP